MWLEMSRDIAHGGTGWGFTECLWSPSHKKSSGKWAFWDSLLRVQKGDIVFHLQGKTHDACFMGYSIADLNGYKTFERPPEPKEWSFAKSFNRVPLSNYIPFSEPILLDALFKSFDLELRKYFDENKKRTVENHEHLFYVVQSNRLQCLNGAYLSELSGDLALILFGYDFSGQKRKNINPNLNAQTNQQLSQVMLRVGQAEFSGNVRKNYNHRCCFPNCPITERSLLVGAHIARWADAPELRGLTSNGLCFCLFHDKAFEIGFFTIDKSLKVSINESIIRNSTWACENILPYQTQQIRHGKIVPSEQALMKHWLRIGFTPKTSNW